MGIDEGVIKYQHTKKVGKEILGEEKGLIFHSF